MKTLGTLLRARVAPDAQLQDAEDGVLVRELEIVRSDGRRSFTLVAPELDLPRGSVTAIVGPSGAGKSTLLAFLAGHLPLGRRCRARWSALRVSLDAAPTLRLRSGGRMGALRKRSTLVLQGGQLVTGLSVFDNCTAAARPRAHEVWQLLDEHGLVPCARQLPQALSGGQHRRGLLARALGVPASLLALDEPCAGLDAERAEQSMRAVLARARAEGRTVLWITHDVARAERLADRVVVITPDADGRTSIVSPARTLRTGARVASRTPGTGRRRFGFVPGVRGILGRAAWRSGVPFAIVRQAFPVGLLAAFVLVVLGLQGGAVASLEDNIRRSPTARRLWVSGLSGNGAVDEASLAAQAARSPNLEIAVPVAPDLGTRTLLANDREASHVRLVGSVSGDPLLRSIVPEGLGERGVVLSDVLRDELDVGLGDEIRVRIGRAPRTASVALRLLGVRSEGRERIARVPHGILQDLQRWLAGASVPALGDAFVRRAPGTNALRARYDALLLLSAQSPPARVREELRVFGTLRERPSLRRDLARALGVASLNGLRAWTLTRPGGYVGTADPDLPTRARRVEGLVTALWDARVVPWCAPLDVTLGEAASGSVRLVGVSLQRPRWLTARTGASTVPFTWSQSDAVLRGGPAATSIVVTSPRGPTQMPVVVEPSQQSVALVPAAFLARLRQLAAGEAVLEGRSFRPRANESLALVGGWVYAHDARSLAAGRLELERAGYDVRQDDQRAREALRTIGILERMTVAAGWLVVPVAFLLCLFLFHACFTPLARAVSSLRLAGLGRLACLEFLLVRGIAVGAVAAGICALAGAGAAASLRRFANVSCIPQLDDYALVLAGLLVVTACAATTAAWSIVRRDPLTVLARAARGV